MPRPSGLPIVDDASSSVILAVAQIEMRGRLNILPRWRQKVEWMRSEAGDVLALMVLSEPGLISITNWKSDGPRIQHRFAELAQSSDLEASQALLLIQGRYQRLLIPAKDRPSLGDAALAHLGLPIDRGAKSVIYVGVFPNKIELMSSMYRNAKLLEGHPLIEDLP